DDITYKKKAEKRLIESEEKFRTIIKTSPNLIFLFDNKAKIIDCNKSAEEYLELSRDEIINKRIYNLLSSISKERALSIIKQISINISRQCYDPIELKYVSHTGIITWFQLYYSPIIVSNKMYIHVELQDFTKLKEAEEIIIKENKKLLQLDEMRKNFIDIASHELKTPLSSVYGSIQLFYDLYKERLNKDSLELIEIARNGSKRLKNLIQNLLDISRIESKRFEISKEQHDLIKLIENCVSELRYLYYKKEQLIELDLPQDLIINIDKSGIERVITNLLSNAIKYSPYNEKIVISLKQNKGKVEIFIKDHGIGLTEHEIKKLFKKFSRLERSGEVAVDINSQGTGLGLFISKQIVELHNGQIWVTSEGRNKGSTFIVSLPFN
ncbi:MAG: ATP-binding protein, partial [Candidatus Hermodarchaeota archaeon]